jgi:ABC-type multidrug transport system fused ATPase/permease subunit
VLFLGGRQVIDGSLSYGEFALFIQLLLQLVWPLESMGWILNLGQRALASAGRTFAWIETVPTLRGAGPAAAAAREPLGVELRDVHFAYPDGEPVLRGVEPVGRARRGARGLRPDRRGEVLAARARAALLRP